MVNLHRQQLAHQGAALRPGRFVQEVFDARPTAGAPGRLEAVADLVDLLGAGERGVRTVLGWQHGWGTSGVARWSTVNGHCKAVESGPQKVFPGPRRVRRSKGMPIPDPTWRSFPLPPQKKMI